MSAPKKKEIDYLAPTPFPPEKGKTSTPDAPMSDKELHEKLALYAQVRGSHEQYIEVERIKQRYLTELKERQANRAKQDINYAQGIRSGLPHLSHDEIKWVREQEDDKLRSQTLSDAKEAYRKSNDNLKKSFEESKPIQGWIKEPFHKAKDLGNDMDK